MQGKSLLPRLAELPEFGGRDGIAQFAWYGLDGGIHNVDGFRVYPKFDDPYGNDVIGAHAMHFGANIVISLIDVWVMHHTAQSIAPALWCPWLPIDSDPVPDEVLNSLRGAHLPLTYAKWGHEMLTAAGVENVYIPHGIEPSIFKVFRDREPVRQFKRELTGLDDSFLCVMVAANKGFPSRKWFEGQLESFRDFRKDVPEAKLYIHSLPSQHHGGVNFERLVVLLGLEGCVIFPNPYVYRLGYPPEYLAMVYNAADAFLGASMSEGFGIPLIEAQACGTPVITTDFSAMPELVHWGHLVDVADKMLIGLHAYQAWPSKASMTDKLRRLYEAWDVCGREWPMAKRQQVSAQIHAKYDWDMIVDTHWRPLMTRLAEEAPPLNRAMQVGGVSVPQVPTDDVQGFVDAVNDGVAQERPKRRVEPLVTPAPVVEPVYSNGNGAHYEAVSNEEVMA